MTSMRPSPVLLTHVGEDVQSCRQDHPPRLKVSWLSFRRLLSFGYYHWMVSVVPLENTPHEAGTYSLL